MPRQPYRVAASVPTFDDDTTRDALERRRGRWRGRLCSTRIVAMLIGPCVLLALLALSWSAAHTMTGPEEPLPRLERLTTVSAFAWPIDTQTCSFSERRCTCLRVPAFSGWRPGLETIVGSAMNEEQTHTLALDRLADLRSVPFPGASDRHPPRALRTAHLAP